MYCYTMTICITTASLLNCFFILATNDLLSAKTKIEKLALNFPQIAIDIV